MSTKSKQINPLYERVKRHVLELIKAENWDEDRRLPSETQLVKACGASRMTVNRALRELAAEGHVERIGGVGTFAADIKVASHPLEIRNIVEEIQSRGHEHSCRVIELTEVRAAVDVAILFSILARSRLYRSRILHLESGTPIQFEVRYVLPYFAPDYNSVDFSQMSTNEYLLKLGPKIEQSEQKLTSELPAADIAEALELDASEHCLVLRRRTWVYGQVVTFSQLYHPASRFQFESTARF
ncbi:MAG: UTRA domain-containing protein [Woeseia sp.]